jgi:hypothetical protein
VTGSTNWKESGRNEHTAGESEINVAKTKNWGEGVIDRAVGKKDAVVGSMTSGRSQEVAGELPLL